VLLRLKFNEKILLIFFIIFVPTSLYYESYVIFSALAIIGSVTLFFCFRTKRFFIRSAKIEKDGIITLEILKWNKCHIEESYNLIEIYFKVDVNTKTRFPEKFLKIKLKEEEELVFHPDAFFKERHIEALGRLIETSDPEN